MKFDVCYIIADFLYRVLDHNLFTVDLVLDAVIALIRRSPTTEEARVGLMGLLGVDEAQAEAIL